MSKYPLGPWSETYPSSIWIPGNTQNNGLTGDQIIGGITIQNSKSREGFRSLPPFVTPTHARLVQNTMQTLEPMTAQCVWPYQGSQKLASGKWYHGWFTYQPGPAPDPKTNHAVDKAFNKFIHKSSSVFKGLVFIGEFKDSVQTVASVLNHLTGRHNSDYNELFGRIAKNLSSRKGSRKQAVRDSARLIADRHLEFQFGISPLISDMDNALDAIARSVVGPRDDHSVQGTYVERNTILGSETTGNLGGFIGPVQSKHEYMRVGKFGANVRPECVTKHEQFPARNFGLGLREVVPAIHELLPYSWLLDYVTNAQEFADLAALHRGIWERGWKVELSTVKSTVTITPRTYYNGQTYPCVGKPGVFEHKRAYFNRDPVNPDLYVPSFRFEHPDLRQISIVASLAVSKLVRPTASRLFSSRERARINRLLSAG